MKTLTLGKQTKADGLIEAPGHCFGSMLDLDSVDSDVSSMYLDDASGAIDAPGSEAGTQWHSLFDRRGTIRCGMEDRERLYCDVERMLSASI